MLLSKFIMLFGAFGIANSALTFLCSDLFVELHPVDRNCVVLGLISTNLLAGGALLHYLGA